MDPKTLKMSDHGVNLTKTIDPLDEFITLKVTTHPRLTHNSIHSTQNIHITGY